MPGRLPSGEREAGTEGCCSVLGLFGASEAVLQGCYGLAVQPPPPAAPASWRVASALQTFMNRTSRSPLSLFACAANFYDAYIKILELAICLLLFFFGELLKARCAALCFAVLCCAAQRGCCALLCLLWSPALDSLKLLLLPTTVNFPGACSFCCRCSLPR